MADPYGITPDEGETYIAEQLYVNGLLKIGLWAGSWDNEEDVVYSEATGRFTKLTAIPGFEEQLMNNWSVATGVGTHTKVYFTAGPGVSNQAIDGWYIASPDNRLVHVQRRETTSYRSSGQTFAVDPSGEVA